MLKHALQSASAPALSAAQEEQLKALIQQARGVHKSITPDPAVKAAHDAYEAAILLAIRLLPVHKLESWPI